MNWDSNAPLELLENMPATLNEDNLKLIQETIDKDKYVCSVALGRDLCGEYAPFCDTCNKRKKYPCAVAYIKMKQLEGVYVEIAPSADIETTQSVEEEGGENVQSDGVPTDNAQPENAETGEVPVEAPDSAETAGSEAEEVPPAKPKRVIRIATARRKG